MEHNEASYALLLMKRRSTYKFDTEEASKKFFRAYKYWDDTYANQDPEVAEMYLNWIKNLMREDGLLFLTQQNQ
jgi:hypothetical protein